METSDFKLEIPFKGYWGILFFTLIGLLLVGRIFPYLFDFIHVLSNLKNSQWIVFIMYYLFVYSLFREISWLTCKVKISIDIENMITTKYFFGIPFTKRYLISTVSNFTIKHNVPGSHYTKSLSYALRTVNFHYFNKPLTYYISAMMEKKTA